MLVSLQIHKFQKGDAMYKKFKAYYYRRRGRLLFFVALSFLVSYYFNDPSSWSLELIGAVLVSAGIYFFLRYFLRYCNKKANQIKQERELIKQETESIKEETRRIKQKTELIKQETESIKEETRRIRKEMALMESFPQGPKRYNNGQTD